MAAPKFNSKSPTIRRIRKPSSPPLLPFFPLLQTSNIPTFPFGHFTFTNKSPTSSRSPRTLHLPLRRLPRDSPRNRPLRMALYAARPPRNPPSNPASTTAASCSRPPTRSARHPSASLPRPAASKRTARSAFPSRATTKRRGSRRGGSERRWWRCGVLWRRM